MERGDHIKVSRGAYSHHGIYAGDQMVIHYSGEPGSKSDACVRRDSLRDFMDGGSVEVIRYSWTDSADTVIRRAEGRLGETDYNLVWNNCEHFARWCKTGESKSEQVQDATSTVAGASGVGAATAGAIGVVAAGGTAAGLSAAGIMSGLAAVGGSAIGGIAALGAAPAAVSVVAMRKVLADDPALPQTERDARFVGRTASVAGGAAGIGGSIAAISAAGTVSGLSAAGITSGLAAIGGVVGGGMAAGAAITIAAPAVAAAAVGYGIYRFVRWLKS